ncbi:MAG: hypothetical protein M4D80_13930 [Myxococcota bacterium]|nr:hypothetical protein [Myxococcota bacterium]
MARQLARVSGAVCVLGIVFGLAHHAWSGPGAQTKITVWGAAPTSAAFGGMTYGGFVPLAGAMITEQREVDVAANGEVRLTGIASTIEPASVQLRDLTEPGVTITEQRYVPGVTSPLEMLTRRIGETVTVVTTKGDVVGVLRAVDEQSLVVEIGTGDQRRLSIMRRDGYVLDVRTPSGSSDKPSLVWRIATKKPGKHTVELTYRADGITWNADYLGVLDDAGKALDFAAWATIRNNTGATFERAEVTLVSGGGALSTATATAALRAPPTPLRFAMQSPIKLAAGDAVQVELTPSRKAAKVRPVITYEATTDLSPSHQEEVNQDCTYNNGVGMGIGRSEVAIELDLPASTTLPDGRVRLFRRKGEQLEVLSEDTLRSMAGVARIKLTADTEITGERKAVTCNVDERAHTIVEKIEVRVENKGKQATDVVIREFAWRWPVWKIESEDKKSVRAGPQTLEYRVKVPPKGKETVTYTLLYTW